MFDQKWLAKSVCFPGFLLVYFIVGWMIPSFYDWSGAGQRHFPPAAYQGFWGLISFGVIAWIVIPWLPMEKTPANRVAKQEEPIRFQFNLYSLLLLTTLVAIVCAAISERLVTLYMMIWVVAFVAAVRMIVRELSWKWQFAALLACMYFPYVWLFSAGGINGKGWGAFFGPLGLPAFVPTLFVSRFVFNSRVEDMIWLLIVMVVAEVVIGFFLVQKKPRSSVAYFVLVMLMSIFGSMFLNAGSRI